MEQLMRELPPTGRRKELNIVKYFTPNSWSLFCFILSYKRNSLSFGVLRKQFGNVVLRYAFFVLFLFSLFSPLRLFCPFFCLTGIFFFAFCVLFCFTPFFSYAFFFTLFLLLPVFWPSPNFPSTSITRRNTPN